MSANPLATLEMQKAFEDYNKLERRRLFKIIAWVAIFAMPAGTTLDMQVYPAYASYFFKLRLASSVLVAVLFLFFYSRWGSKYDRLLFLILPTVPISFITWMIYATEGPLSPYYAGLNVVLVAFCLVVPWTYQETLVVSLATMAIYMIACVGHGGLSFGGIFFNNFYFLLLTATFAVMGSYFTNLLRLREFTTRYELDQNRKKLAESNQKLIELDEVKSRFFANISHELRTPLTLLISPLEVLQTQTHLFDEATREILRTMQDNAMRLLKLINDLLDLVKLESGRMEIRKEPLNIEAFIKGLVLSVQGVAKDKRVLLSSRVERDLGVLLIDRDKLEKILLNLVFNSVKFTPAGGGVELSVFSEGDHLSLKVKDTGMGISEKDLSHIFDRFWQADGSAQRKYQGTGIGLALVKELAEAQGGTVQAESQLSQGTTMTILLPLERAGSDLPLVPALEVLPAGASPVESSEWLTKLYRRAEMFPAMTPLSNALLTDHYGKTKRPKVLIADDEPDMLKFLRSQLEKYYDVIEAVDGNQAVEKAKQFLPDLILLDMMMPEKDGIEACREIKAMTSTQAIPVVLLTARADDETKMSSLGAGASDFLTKPFSTTELHVRVKNLVESHQFQRDLVREKSALESTLERLKETEGQLVQNEKMASLGRLSAGIIHEINNPLNYATTALHLLKMKKDHMPEEERAKYGEIVSDIAEGVDRVQRIVSDLRTFTHPKMETVMDLIELEEVVSTALRFLSHELKNKIKVEIHIAPGQRVLADKNKLVHVLLNLTQNSTDALKERIAKKEDPSLWINSRFEGGKVMVSVKDNGEGIAPGNLDKIFDPFFTTKDVGQGMGLGLSLCYKMMGEQGGRISVNSRQGEFTEFILELPAGS